MRVQIGRHRSNPRVAAEFQLLTPLLFGVNASKLALSISSVRVAPVRSLGRVIYVRALKCVPRRYTNVYQDRLGVK